MGKIKSILILHLFIFSMSSDGAMVCSESNRVEESLNPVSGKKDLIGVGLKVGEYGKITITTTESAEISCVKKDMKPGKEKCYKVSISGIIHNFTLNCAEMRKELEKENYFNQVVMKVMKAKRGGERRKFQKTYPLPVLGKVGISFKAALMDKEDENLVKIQAYHFNKGINYSQITLNCNNNSISIDSWIRKKAWNFTLGVLRPFIRKGVEQMLQNTITKIKKAAGNKK